MLCSKVIMEPLPNIHPVGMLTMVYTIVFRKKALIPLYIYVFLNGVLLGFSPWWVPYLYIFTILWAVTMILPRKMKKSMQYTVYPIVCALHGLAFGILYAPAHALMFGFDFEQTLLWISTGISWDFVHCFGNFFIGLLIVPLSELLKKLSRIHNIDI